MEPLDNGEARLPKHLRNEGTLWNGHHTARNKRKEKSVEYQGT